MIGNWWCRKLTANPIINPSIFSAISEWKKKQFVMTLIVNQVYLIAFRETYIEELQTFRTISELAVARDFFRLI